MNTRNSIAAAFGCAGRARCAALFVWTVALATGALVSAQQPQPQPQQPGGGQGNQQVGQGRRPVPTDTYFFVFREFYDGGYDRALRDFLREGRGAIKTVESNWIDSICYNAMAGECYFQMGQLAKAQEHFDAALQLYAAFADWMIRVQFQPVLNPANQGAIRPCPWGQSGRPARWAGLSTDDTVSIAQGQINNNQVVQQGGVVQQAQLFPIRPGEIVRMTALAIRRRAELLGPLGENDTLSRDVLASLTRRPTQPNHWSECWIDVQLGLAFAATGKYDQARPVLERAVLAAGEFNHPLTGVALLELGKLALRGGDFNSAARLFEEATYAAFAYDDAIVLEEAFRYGTLTHIVSNQPGVYPPLVAAAEWARSRSLRQLQTSLNLMMAECVANAGDAAQANSVLSTARGLMGNRAMSRGKLGARYNFLSAQVQYQAGKTADGDALLADLLKFQRGASHWMYQIDLTDAQLSRGTLPPRTAMLIYQQLLREPSASDWLYDPLESLSAIALPHPQSYENWFEVALGRREMTAALDIADLSRRHRFLAALPLGGRPLGLRWVLEAPKRAISPAAQLERQDLLARYPQYSELSQQARQLETELSREPLVPSDQDARRRQAGGLKRLAELSQAQEQLLRTMSVRRNPGSLSFPPKRAAKEIQDALDPGQAVLAFYATRRHVYGFLITHDGFNGWEVNSPAAVQRKVVQLLREMGMTDANRDIPQELLIGDKWQKPSRELWALLTDNAKTELFEGLDELIIVPDGPLWYVPFAALQVGPEGQSEPLISKVRLRLAPLVAMTVPGSRGRSTNATTAVAVGKMMVRDAPEVGLEAFDAFSRAVPGSVALSGVLSVPSPIFGSLIRRLVVLDDLRGTDEDTLLWSPLPLDQNPAQGALVNWLDLPFAGPDEIILPGFHTAAENALKKRGPDNGGDEVFRDVCSLMAAGAQTVLMSQWRSGGRTSYDLVREFMQELPHTTASEAWQRSVQLVMAADVDAEHEPRVKLNSKLDPPRSSHPFFWAGYLLIDTGATSGDEGEDDGARPDVADNVAPGALVLEGDTGAPRGALPPAAGAGGVRNAPADETEPGDLEESDELVGAPGKAKRPARPPAKTPRSRATTGPNRG